MCVKAVILAGGLGTRLQPYTIFLPKPMLPLGEKPILEHLIDWTKKNGIKSIVLCVSYLRKTIQNYFDNGKRFGVNIEYAISDKPLATAGQLFTARDLLRDTFVCIYGDSIFNFSLRNMIKHHYKENAFVTMSVNEYKTNLQYGVIKRSKKGKVLGWDEKPEIKFDVNVGCYIMEPKILELIPKNKPYGMDDLVRKAISKKKLITSFKIKEFTDIGDKPSYKKAYQRYIEKLGKI